MRKRGLRISHYHSSGKNPLDEVEYETRRCQILDADGEMVFESGAVKVPRFWSQLAGDIAISKYLRRRGVPGGGGEKSIRQLIERVSQTIRGVGEKKGYFASRGDADTFQKELAYLLVHQHGSFNSPVWFNVGLAQHYGIQGSGGNFYFDEKTNRPEKTADAYSYPQSSACFIQSVDDDLDSIFALAKNEARIFKYGSGTGTNFSRIRGATEYLSGGGHSSGLMSFLEVLDKGAGTIKSGGTTRRAAKMVCLDADHPEIFEFVRWKAEEEKKAAALIGAGYSAGLDGEAYRSVSGQNANNSVRLSDRFLQAVEKNGPWHTRLRTTGKVHKKFPAQKLFREIAAAAWACADPGVHFETTINRFHTCPETGPIRSSNPCSEFLFLDDTACNLASINLLKYLSADGEFAVEAFRHACRIFLLAQEILVDFSSYPTEKIAKNSHDFRPLGLGYANLGGLLMARGIAYDSVEARAWCGAITALLHGTALECSAEIATIKGPFAGYRKNSKAMLAVLRKQAKASKQIPAFCPQALLLAAQTSLDSAVRNGNRHGFRNAQVTVLAPTGTISLLMDCDTTGIEPDFALVKFKKLSGGGSCKIVNRAIPLALQNLGYSKKASAEILRYLEENSSIEGAPSLKAEHLPIFDCANPGEHGKRHLSVDGHLLMLAAAQPFLSGAISKTVNLPEFTSIEEIEALYLRAWKLGLKSLAVYRDNSKLSQPLSTSQGDEADRFYRKLQEDTPNCPICAHATIRNGACFQCLHCGHSLSCS